MKKSLIAAAVVASFSASAFADTTVYGLLDAALVNVSNTNQKSQTLTVSGGLAASRLGFKGSEDLGDGLSAIAQYEVGVDSQTVAGFGGAATRQSLLGLSSASVGTVAAGYLQTTGYDFAGKYDPTAGSAISPLQNLTTGNAQFLIGSKATATRAQRALAYISPNFSGVTVAVNYATALVGTGNLGVSSANANANTTATLASIGYNADALSVGGVYASVSSPAQAAAGTFANEKEYALGASYDFSVAKVYGTYQSTHNDAPGAAGNSNRIYSLSGTIPVAGAGVVVLSYANAKIKTDTSGNSDGSSYTLGFLHPLSKTTTAYAALSHAGNNANGAFSVDNSAVGGAGQAGASASSNLWAVGLQKKF
jgi:predicted porin